MHMHFGEPSCLTLLSLRGLTQCCPSPDKAHTDCTLSRACLPRLLQAPADETKNEFDEFMGNDAGGNQFLYVVQ